MNQYDHVWARFAPKRQDDLTPTAQALIGRACEFQAAWIVEHGDYAGEWAMTPIVAQFRDFPVGWVPLCDLIEVEHVERDSVHTDSWSKSKAAQSGEEK